MSNEELGTDFSPERKVSGLKLKMGRLYERLKKKPQILQCLKYKQKMQPDSTLEFYPIKNVKRLYNVRNKNQYT